MRATIDGNEAAASVAYRLNEVCCIYPITPSSTMAELADEWASKGRTNVWGTVPAVVEMQSEGGAAGALHGALQSGALSTTFTASQGLLLMIPNMYKIAGELTAAVMHVAARSLAAQGLSIFGDHSDVMAVRQTGFALLASASVQEAHDLALVAQAATLETRVPFVHFFDGFRTSHELNTIEMLSDDDLRALVPEELVRAHRDRALSPERPFIRGTAQNPDVYFQARETVNPFYARIPDVVEDVMTRLGERTGRRFHLVDYSGHPDAERVLVVMGSGAETVRETVASLNARGERVGVRAGAAVPALPGPGAASTRCPRACAGSRCSTGPRSLARSASRCSSTWSPRSPSRTRTVSGRSCRGCPAAATGCRRRSSPRAWSPGCSRSSRASGRGAGSRSASTTTSPGRAWPTTRRWISSPPTPSARSSSGWASDGTVGANKNTIKILGSEEHLNAQGYFVYDSKKSGSQTVSHLRFGPQPIRAPYLVQRASFVGCHQFGLLDQVDVLGRAAPGATLLLNCRHAPDEVWDALSRPVQEQILAKRIEVYAINAGQIAREVGLAGRINVVLQTCFFAISGVLPRDEAIARIKEAIEKTYGRRGAEVVETQPGGGRPGAGGAAPDRGARPGDGHPRAAAAGARARAGVRPRRHRGDDGRPRRRPAGQRAAGGRHLPERHDGVREAQHLRAGRGLGLRPVHPMRQLQLRLPPQRDPLQVLRAVPPGGRAGRVPVGSTGGPRAPGQPLHAAGLRRGLHRMWAVRRGLPGRGAGRPGPQGDQPRPARAAGRRRA